MLLVVYRWLLLSIGFYSCLQLFIGCWSLSEFIHVTIESCRCLRLAMYVYTCDTCSAQRPHNIAYT